MTDGTDRAPELEQRVSDIERDQVAAVLAEAAVRRATPGVATAVGTERPRAPPVAKERLSANPAEPGYPCYVSVLGELAWMPPRGELTQV